MRSARNVEAVDDVDVDEDERIAYVHAWVCVREKK